MQDCILLIFCILITSFIGWNILYLLIGRKHFFDISIFEKIGLSYIFGFGIISIEMFVIGLLGIKFTRFSILFPWFFVVIAVMSLIKIKSTRPKFPFRLNKFSLTLICFIVIQTLYNFFRALIRPIESYDAVAIYGLKSKMMYLAGGIDKSFFQSIASNFHGAHPDYPLFIPLSETWVYTFLAKFDDILVKAIFPLFCLAFILIFYALLKRLTQNRTLALLFTFVLVSIKQFSDYTTIAVADLALGAFFAISLLYLYLWMEKREKQYFLNISLVSSLLCVWTKNEGTLLALIAVFILFLYAAMNVRNTEKREILRIFTYILIVITSIVAWGMFKAYHGLVNENFNLSMIGIKNFVQNLNKIPIMLYEYQKQLFGFKKWNIIWILFIFVLIKGFKTVFSDNTKYITWTFFLFGLSYSLIYIFSTVEIDFFLRKTASRFLLHILPLAVFFTAVNINDIYNTENTGSLWKKS